MGRDVQAGSEGAVLGTQAPLWTQVGTCRPQSRGDTADSKGSLGKQNFTVVDVWGIRRTRLIGISSGVRRTERSLSLLTEWPELSVLSWTPPTRRHLNRPPVSRSSGLLGITKDTLVPQALASLLPHLAIDCLLWTPPFLLPHFCYRKGRGLQVSAPGPRARLGEGSGQP